MEHRQTLIEKYRENLITCVRAFIKLHGLRILSSRSWTVLHNGLSSTLLMSFLNFSTRTAEAHQLLGEVVDTLSSEESDPGTGTQRQEKNGNIKLSGPHIRVLTVLKKLYSNRIVDPERPVSSYISSRQLQPTADEHVANQQVLSTAILRRCNTDSYQRTSLMSEERLYLEVVPVWLTSPNDMNRGNISPLDYFDSLLWGKLYLRGNGIADSSSQIR